MDGGADIRVVQELLGHSSPNTEIYTHISLEKSKYIQKLIQKPKINNINTRS